MSNSNDNYEIDKYAYEENIIPRYHDPIELGDPATTLNEWKYKYYKTYYNVETDYMKNKTDIHDYALNNILESYTQGLVWTLYYYYDECKDYEWFFEHHHGPFISDLLSYIKLNGSKVEHFEELYSANGIWFQNQIKPLQQLMLVLPHESSFLIPTSYRNLMFSNVLSHYFPERIMDIKMDYLYKNKAWQNIPMIDIIPGKTIINLTSKVILKDEEERNQTYYEIIKEK
jgi:5'-3' exonuclease